MRAWGVIEAGPRRVCTVAAGVCKGRNVRPGFGGRNENVNDNRR